MTTKLSISEQIMRILAHSNRTPDEQLDQREVILLIEQVANSLAKDNQLSMLKSGFKDINSNYLSTFKDVPVLYDDSTDRDYALLPARYVYLPKNKGVYTVASMKGIDSEFIPVPPDFMSMYKNQYSGSLQGQVGYYVEGAAIFFTRKIKTQNDLASNNANNGILQTVGGSSIDKLLIRLVIVSLADIDEDAPLPISPEDEIKIIQAIASMLTTTKINDRINDGIDNK